MELGKLNFRHLSEFAQHFMAFLENNRSLFPENLQRSQFLDLCRMFLTNVHSEIDDKVKKQISEKGQISDDEVSEVLGSTVQQRFKLWNEYPRLDHFPGNFEDEIVAKYKDDVEQLIGEIFARLPVAKWLNELLQICSFHVTRDWWWDWSGGVVVAGFGQEDIFPVLRCYMVDTVVQNRLKHTFRPTQSNDMNESGAASIIPFAQAEMVHRFIRGVDPEYRQELKEFIRNLLTVEYPNRLLQQFETRLTEEEHRSTRAELIRLARAVVTDFDGNWSVWEHKKFISPVLDIVGELPKEDLAEMAESLVNLTSFKRKITAEAETVGGPIDVAVISKGDGFVWIKRKHYFDKELNPGFFANYYKGDAG